MSMYVVLMHAQLSLAHTAHTAPGGPGHRHCALYIPYSSTHTYKYYILKPVGCPLNLPHNREVTPNCMERWDTWWVFARSASARR